MKERDDLLNITQAARLLNVTPTTLRNWDKAGKLTTYRTTGGHRRYSKEELLDLIGPEDKEKYNNKIKNKIVIGYARVSTSEQREDLKRQEQVIQNYCEKQGYRFKIISDIGSGINYNKKGLQELIELLCTKQVEVLVINYKDRLIRFGYELIEQICDIYNVPIEIINETKEITYEQELVEDVLSIITVYSAKLYGSRSHKNKKIVETTKQLFEEEE